MWQKMLQTGSGGSAKISEYSITDIKATSGADRFIIDCTSIPNYSTLTMDKMIVRFDGLALYNTPNTSTKNTLTYTYDATNGKLTIFSSGNLFKGGLGSDVTVFVVG